MKSIELVMNRQWNVRRQQAVSVAAAAIGRRHACIPGDSNLEQSVAAARMRSSNSDLRHSRRQTISDSHGSRGDRCFAFRKIPTLQMGTTMLVACILGDGGAGRWSCAMSASDDLLWSRQRIFQQQRWAVSVTFHKIPTPIITSTTSCMLGLGFADVRETSFILQPASCGD